MKKRIKTTPILAGRTGLLFVVLLFAFSSTALSAPADARFQLAGTLHSPAPRTEGWFGNSVALDAGRIIVGEAFGDAGTTARAGSVHVFGPAGDLLMSLYSPSPRKEGSFGGEEYCNKLVALGDELFAVGETRAQGGGKAYLFTREGTIVSVLKPPEALRGSREFGNSLAMSDGRLLVGSYNAGAYLYDGAGVPLASLKGENGSTQDGFGMATALKGDTIVVTQDHAIAGGVRDAGAAYIYDGQGRLKQRIQAPDPQQPGLFGVSAATNGELIVIGSPEATASDRARAGLAYIFTADGALRKTLVAPVETLNFGVAVAVDQDSVVVGASGARVNGLRGAGLAFVFDADGAYRETLQSPNPATGGNFGWSVASEGGTIVVSAPGDEVNGKGAAGEVYVFTAR